MNTGENGWFAHGEFEAITALDQMEIITPEEIARATVQELIGRKTGTDVIAAIDASIMGPTFKGGLVRQVALDRIAQLEEDAAPCRPWRWATSGRRSSRSTSSSST